MDNVLTLPVDWDKPAIARRLKLLRKAMKWDQDRAAAVAGVTSRQWSNYETGRSGIPYYAAQRLDLRAGFAIQWIYNNRLDALPGYLQEKIAKAEATLGPPGR